MPSTHGLSPATESQQTEGGRSRNMQYSRDMLTERDAGAGRARPKNTYILGLSFDYIFPLSQYISFVFICLFSCHTLFGGMRWRRKESPVRTAENRRKWRWTGTVTWSCITPIATMIRSRFIRHDQIASTGKASSRFALSTRRAGTSICSRGWKMSDGFNILGS